MIYQRQSIIENFEKKPFFELESMIQAKQGAFKATLSPTKRFNSKEELETFVTSKSTLIGKQSGNIYFEWTQKKTTQ